MCSVQLTRTPKGIGFQELFARERLQIGRAAETTLQKLAARLRGPPETKPKQKCADRGRPRMQLFQAGLFAAAMRATAEGHAGIRSRDIGTVRIPSIKQRACQRKFAVCSRSAGDRFCARVGQTGNESRPVLNPDAPSIESATPQISNLRRRAALALDAVRI
jgi:hypothetical protein